MADEELLQAMRAMIQEETRAIVREEMKPLEASITKLTTCIEYEVKPDIQKLAEGHELILERLDDKLTERTESLQDQLDVHSAAIRQINRELRELKKAQ